MNALLKRTKGGLDEDSQKPVVYQIGQFRFDRQNQKLTAEDKEKQLSTKEAELLALLCEYENRTLPREEALRRVWGDDDFFTARSMDVYITKLRKYLKSDPSVNILNARGKGYKLLVNNDG